MRLYFRSLLVLALIASAAHADEDWKKTAEAGWKAYQKKDVAKAEELTRKAIADSGNDTVTKGAALYNLGRILEDKQDKAGAITAYKDSWGVRHNNTVRERLRTLDAAAAASIEPLAPKRLTGPFADRLTWCKQLLVDTTPAQVMAGPVDNCTDPAVAPTLKPKTAFKLAPPYEDVQFLTLVLHFAVIVVKADGKLYFVVVRPFEDSECDEAAWTFDGVTQRGGVLDVAYRANGKCGNKYGKASWSEHASTIIGIGPSKVPSSIELKLALTEHGEWELEQLGAPTWSKDGRVLDVAVKKSSGEPFGRVSVPTEDLKGHHELLFP